MFSGIAAAMQRVTGQFESRVESVTSSQETGKAVTTRENQTVHVGSALVDASTVK